MLMSKEILGSLELNRIYQHDCIEGMRMIPDKSVDLIVIDPPYNIGKDKRWDKWKTVDDYVEWMSKVFKECERVITPNGSFYWFHNDFEQVVELQMSIKEGTNFIFKQFIVWNKRFNEASNKGFLDGFLEPQGLRNYQKMAEYCLYYTLQDETGLKTIQNDFHLFEPIREYFKKEREKIAYLSYPAMGKKLGLDRQVVNNWLSSYKKNWHFPTKEGYKILQQLGICQRPYEDLKKEYGELKQHYEGRKYTFNNQKTHHSVWNYEIAPKQGHLTPKPVDLIENIIHHSSNEGDVVLDCFMGSGTTAVAAVRTGRKFIGFEREPEYIEIANKRLDNEMEAI